MFGELGEGEEYLWVEPRSSQSELGRLLCILLMTSSLEPSNTKQLPILTLQNVVVPGTQPGPWLPWHNRLRLSV
jgi:hypothetical protein